MAEKIFFNKCISAISPDMSHHALDTWSLTSALIGGHVNSLAGMLELRPELVPPQLLKEGDIDVDLKAARLIWANAPNADSIRTDILNFLKKNGSTIQFANSSGVYSLQSSTTRDEISVIDQISHRLRVLRGESPPIMVKPYRGKFRPTIKVYAARVRLIYALVYMGQFKPLLEIYKGLGKDRVPFPTYNKSVLKRFGQTLELLTGVHIRSPKKVAEILLDSR